MSLPTFDTHIRPLPWRRLALIWLGLGALSILFNLAGVIGHKFPDPDDMLRLAQVRDLIAGQGWFDHHQYRIDPPQGTLMHWSRIVDVPIAGLIVLLTPLLGQAGAENAALILIPLLTMGAILLVVARLAQQCLEGEARIFACLAIGLSSLLVAQLQPLRIDHHGWQIFTVILAMLGLMPGRERFGPVLIGLAMATGLSISIELLPITAAFAVVLGLRWLADRASRWQFVRFLAALAAGSGALFLLSHAGNDFITHCDAISPVHLLAMGVLAVGSCLVALIRRLPLAGTVALLALVGMAGAAAYLLGAPACMDGPFANLDPLVRQFWYENVLEGRPFWKLSYRLWLPVLAQSLVVLAVLAWLVRHTRDHTRRWWSEYLLITAASLFTGMLVWRSLAFTGVLATIPLGWLTARLLLRLRASPDARGQLLAALMVMLALMPGFPITLATVAFPPEQPSTILPGNRIVSAPKESTCEIADYAAQLSSLPRSTVFAPLDIGPAIVEGTPHSVIATGHHRGEPAMRDVIAAFTSSPDQARQIVRAHGASYLIMCTDMFEPLMFAHQAPEGLAAQILVGNPPAWLEPVPMAVPETLKVWRVAD